MTFKEELDAFHRKLVGLPDDSIGAHLRNGPIPQTEEECIYAAQRTIPMLEGRSADAEPGAGANIRLRMIKRQIEAISDQSPELLLTLGQVNDVVRDAEKRARNDTILGCGCLTLIALGIIIPLIVWAVG